MNVCCFINIRKSIHAKLSLEYILTRKQMRFLLQVEERTLLAKLFLFHILDLKSKKSEMKYPFKSALLNTSVIKFSLTYNTCPMFTNLFEA